LPSLPIAKPAAGCLVGKLRIPVRERPGNSPHAERYVNIVSVFAFIHRSWQWSDRTTL